MNRNPSACCFKSLIGSLAVAIAIAAISGCAAVGPVELQEPAYDPYHGASLEPDLGSVALRVADAAPRLDEQRGI